MAWESGMFCIPIVRKLLSRRRFEQIMRAWHYIDTSNMTNAEVTSKNAEDPFWTVEPLVTHIAKVSMRCYHCSQHIYQC